jgi:hypothetical protein
MAAQKWFRRAEAQNYFVYKLHNLASIFSHAAAGTFLFRQTNLKTS